jgi:uncharacterized protein with PIN domain
VDVWRKPSQAGELRGDVGWVELVESGEGTSTLLVLETTMSKPFAAMYRSRCPRCGEWIEEGSMVKMASIGYSTRKAVHVDCSTKMPVKEFKPKKQWVGPEASFERRAEAALMGLAEYE